MLQHLQRWRWLLLLALLLVAVPVLAQTAGSYELRWWTADAGRSQLSILCETDDAAHFIASALRFLCLSGIWAALCYNVEHADVSADHEKTDSAGCRCIPSWRPNCTYRHLGPGWCIGSASSSGSMPGCTANSP
jgi:hypothetical protein